MIASQRTQLTMPMLAPKLCVEDYVIVRHAATGGMSEVYEAYHMLSGERAALKVLLEEWCEDQELKTRFRNEAIALDTLRHRRIVTLLGQGDLPRGGPYMILEWMPQSLEQALFGGGALQVDVAIRLGAQIAEGLSALHDRGVVHRDLKPANVLLDDQDLAIATAKLSDLGFAKMIQGRAGAAAATLPVLPISTGASEVLGSMDYMAPEQWMKSKDADPRADVYAFGVLLFQALTGNLPFLGEDARALMMLHLFEQPPLRLLDKLAPPDLGDLIGRMLCKEPSDRPSMREVQETLGGL